MSIGLFHNSFHNWYNKNGAREIDLIEDITQKTKTYLY